MAKEKLNELKMSYSAAIVAAAGMLLLSLAGYAGLYTGAVEQMQRWHMFYSLTSSGIIAGMIEAAVISFVFIYALVWIYNKLL